MNKVLATRVVTIGIGLASVRIVAFSFLLFCEWTGRQSVALVPLLLLLYPEALLLRNDVTWTAARAIWFGGLLLIGSFVLGLLAAMVVTLVRD
ncbi:MAG TPA: hypothetical protein VFF31_32700 [Blastocatellia bacterium]|jgi:hypothetical protein|nr:hypothetical protein [Blastocatellia bacterium]